MDAILPEAFDEAPEYELVCVKCGHRIPAGQDTHAIHCPGCGKGAFLRTDYADTDLVLRGPEAQFVSYGNWLPFAQAGRLPSLAIGCVQAPALAASLGLGEVWILVSGFAPGLGADLPTCTFKTLEAAGVMQRVLGQTDKTLIVSSAGNAGCAVLEFGAQQDVPAVVVIPEKAAGDMLVSVAPGERAPLLICLRDAAYPDAIALVGELQQRFAGRLVREGGAYNVARRDAMGVPFLRAVQAIGKLPDHYFQAVGSGTGGIAAHEAAGRLTRAGFPGGPTRLHLVQNAPFAPMVDAWRAGLDEVAEMPRDEVLRRLAQTYTTVLANAHPPYGVAGGVRDALTESGGEMIAVDNDEARRGHAIIQQHLELDAYPEGGAAMAGLLQASERGLPAGESVLVHVTGAGQAHSIEALKRRPYPIGLTTGAGEVDEAAAAVASYLDRVAG